MNAEQQLVETIESDFDRVIIAEFIRIGREDNEARRVLRRDSLSDDREALKAAILHLAEMGQYSRLGLPEALMHRPDLMFYPDGWLRPPPA